MNVCNVPRKLSLRQKSTEGNLGLARIKGDAAFAVNKWLTNNILNHVWLLYPLNCKSVAGASSETQSSQVVLKVSLVGPIELLLSDTFP